MRQYQLADGTIETRKTVVEDTRIAKFYIR